MGALPKIVHQLSATRMYPLHLNIFLSFRKVNFLIKLFSNYFFFFAPNKYYVNFRDSWILAMCGKYFFNKSLFT